MEAGSEIALRVDQVLLNDSAGPEALLFFEAIGADRVRPITAAYVDHDLEDRKAHDFLRAAAARFGILFSPPGAGICHLVHLERLAAPGTILVGTDSRTPAAGALGAFGLAASRLDVASAMAGAPLRIAVPRVVAVRVRGALRPWVTPTDVALHLLGRLTVRGGTGRVLEFVGPGLKALDVPARATIANVAVETGAVGVLFPSDATARRFLSLQGRARAFRRLEAVRDAGYDEEILLDLRKVEPMVAQPPSPDHVVPIREVDGEAVAQVCVGSCAGAQFESIALFARALRGRAVHPAVEVLVVPGTRRILSELAREGILSDLAACGVRVLEAACGPCIGACARPGAGSTSLRTFQRNLDLRSGTPGARLLLAGPAAAAAAALKGAFADPRRLGAPPRVAPPRPPSDRAGPFVAPPRDGKKIALPHRDRYRPVGLAEPAEDRLVGRVRLKAPHHHSTEAILRPPPGAALAAGEGGFVVGGDDFGQGSAREAAAFSLAAAGIRAAIARSFARATRTNLLRAGVLPLLLDEAADYDVLQPGDTLEAVHVRAALKGGERITLVRSDGKVVRTRLEASPQEREAALAGGLIPLLRNARSKRR